ncbi:hypothetical protein [Massiliimalia timonensis]|uniref:hypothetical protein n=1 Tax=Massiliimalia timonensis TaxID=1987501 RepID=UPI000B8B56DA|nr:hypothetical protein [Massiliimalia timonensis]
MAKTSYSIKGVDFYINGQKTYTELSKSDPKVHGLLFNARFIQGVFEDKNPQNRGKYDRFGKIFSADDHTDALIQALPSWYKKGIRAITVGLQGGGPIYTYEDWSVIDSGCFSKDGKTIDPGYCERLTRIIKACDELGMLVIVSILYQAQAHLLEDGVALGEAVKTACTFLKGLPYSNIIIEVANEQDVGDFEKHPLISSGEGMGALLRLTREWSGGRFAVGSSGGGGSWKPEIVSNSDVILVHGNGLRRREYYDFIRSIQAYAPDKPIVCNEDSQCFGQLSVSEVTHTSWGYYNNMTKQEPPADWSVTAGEDDFFARRLEQMIYGREEVENEFYLQGFEPDCHIDGRRYIKLASLYPEKINYVEFYENDRLLYTSFDEPFMLYALNTLEQRPYRVSKDAQSFTAVIYLHSGQVVERKVTFE